MSTGSPTAPLKVIKIGGNVVDNPEALTRFALDFTRLEGPKLLVHGGGKEATRLSQALGIPTQMIDGRRVTDLATLDVVTMVYAGLVNKRVVALLQSLGVNAMGLSGADANAIRATRRNPVPIDYGYVGDISAAGVNAPVITHLTQAGITPVFCAITHDGNGTLLNCNADSVASAIAKGCAAVMDVELIYCFEKDGVLTDVDRPDSLITHVTPEIFADLRAKGVVSAGMIPKLQNALEAISCGVKSVTIKNAANLLSDRGTVITA